MNTILNFVYVNTKNEVKAQSITNISQNDEYLQGESLLPDEDRKLKTFRKDRVVKYTDSIDESEKYIVDGLDTGEFYISKPKSESFDVHFTGFLKADKEKLTELATNAGMIVRKSVTVNLKLLCYGYNASQMKMDKARGMGIIILNEEQFRNFLLTGDFTD
ncbi:hypothetical protein V6478_002020 [Providencia rettgeri]|uniref:hypothetical protein n=1 Tax=Providencia rettgeri TaxID=587 RepID=UPI0025A7D6F2|nr:hypothetical protein [Providencia rettgeri]ELR5064164.1 hypothetical protein [Providencia rettgeri]ELR5164423.1 hypothetical protein [Providencia rettgeri]EMA4645066.1 hypothetical protein [Providencia rettgeri]WRR96451.1 hypothetical protein VNI59_17140 [Providencia rettgeri]